jgi:pimeloyl-ACP methyl ester carboxylesterase
MNPDFRMIESNGVTLRAAVQGEGPLVVMVHGFPESWYSWRHQMAPLAASGFTACAIDVRGYGGSDKPHDVEAYSMANMAADVAGVIDALSANAPAVLIGHDWGAPIVWHTAVLHPSKVRGVAGLSVPYYALPPMPLNQIFKAMYTDQGKFFYMAYFQNEGVAEAEFEADVRGALRKLYFAASAQADGRWGNAHKPADEPMLKGLPDPEPFPAWLMPADIDYYVGEFERSGFRGPINRYRNFERDWAMMSAVEDRKIHQPSLFIAGAQDMVLKMFGDGNPDTLVATMREQLSDFRGAHIIPGAGHWVQQEAPQATTAHMIDWLATL